MDGSWDDGALRSVDCSGGVVLKPGLNRSEIRPGGKLMPTKGSRACAAQSKMRGPAPNQRRIENKPSP
jgi:hypothetical protein